MAAVTLEAFFDRLRPSEHDLALERRDQLNNLAGGDILQAEIAPPIWSGSVVLPPMAKRDAAEIQAQLAQLEMPGATFRARKPQQNGPASDPDGAALAGASVTISAVYPADAARLDLSGLPAGFDLSAGDFLAFDYVQGGRQKRAFHKVLAGGPADAAGDLAGVRLVPDVRPGAAAGAAVDLARPSFLAVLVPGSVSHGKTRHNITSGISFRFRQTFRG